MRKYAVLVGLLTAMIGASAQAELEVYKDYDLGSEITMMTTVKIDPNMEDLYLEGLRDTWIKAVRMQKDLGHIKDWKIFSSDIPQSGNFNMVLLVTFENAADLEPNKARYESFMEKWGKANQENSRKVSKTYPEIRTLTGQYRLREIIMK